MSSDQMGHFMPITYLPPTSHLQFYNLPTNQPTYLNVLPIYQPTHPPAYLQTIYLPTYLDELLTYLLICLSTHL
jgi:hypothetical protein